MNVFQHPDFAGHEQVVFCHDEDTALRALIAVHNTNLGPALGGIRMWPYTSEGEALRDVLRLSRGMTYKSALAGLQLGGGKSVIIGNPRTEKTPELIRAMGKAIDRLAGRYIGAEDSGTTVSDLKTMSEVTTSVAGIVDKEGAAGKRSGDPSPATAYGVFVGIRATVKYRLGRDDLGGLTVAIQGVGNVGYRLGEYLKEAGAKLWITDIYDDQLERASKELAAQVVAPDDIFALDVDVFAPCAMGSVINDSSLSQLRAKVIAGAANNQLAENRHGIELMRRGILYAPDYVINAGGIIDIAYERSGHERTKVLRHIERIGDTLSEIFERAKREELPTNQIADQMAEERFRRPAVT